MAFPEDDPNYDWNSFNFDEDPQRLSVMGRILNATNSDLSGFYQSGGKLLLWQGWSDPAITPLKVIQYYEQVRKRLGEDHAWNTVRLFMVPGMNHCSDGPGFPSFDYLTTLEQWVEEGRPPESIVAEGTDIRSNTLRSRPLCPYPMVARYIGVGSVNDAKNFVCVNAVEKNDARVKARLNLD